MDKKMNYLVSHDFGKSGVWGIVSARSITEIKAKYPELEIVKEISSSLDKAEIDNIAASPTFDIDDEPRGWLAEMVRDRIKK
jgi:hypothetical protein